MKTSNSFSVHSLHRKYGEAYKNWKKNTNSIAMVTEEDVFCFLGNKN